MCAKTKRTFRDMQISLDGAKAIRYFMTSTSVSDPDPYVIGPPGSFYHQAKIVIKTLDSYCFVTSF